MPRAAHAAATAFFTPGPYIRPPLPSTASTMHSSQLFLVSTQVYGIHTINLNAPTLRCPTFELERGARHSSWGEVPDVCAGARSSEAPGQTHFLQKCSVTCRPSS